MSGASKTVLLFGDGILASIVGDILSSLKVCCFRPYESLTASSSDYLIDFAVITSDEWSPNWEQTTLKELRNLQIPILPILGKLNQVYVGPLELPGVQGCIDCFNAHWTHTYKRGIFLDMIQQQSHKGKPRNSSLDASADFLASVRKELMVEIKVLLMEEKARIEGKVGIFRIGSNRFTWKTVLPSHHCERCNLTLLDSPESVEIHFQSSFMKRPDKVRVQDLDFPFLKNNLVDEDVGYISHIDMNKVGPCIHATAHILLTLTNDVAGNGMAMTHENACRAAVLEAIERSCGYAPLGRQTQVKGTFQQLQRYAIHPSVFGFYDDAIYAYEQENGQLRPFSEGKSYSWVWAYSCQKKRPVLVPEQNVYFKDPAENGEDPFVYETTNGCAVGTTLEEAILYGILEVVERDALLNTWYARIPLPELKLGNDTPGEVIQLIESIADFGFDIRFFAMSLNLKLPSILAVAINRNHATPKVLCGTATHLLPYVAVEKALSELLVLLSRITELTEQELEEAKRKLNDETKLDSLWDHAITNSLVEVSDRWAFLLDNSRDSVKEMDETFGGVFDYFAKGSNDIKVILENVIAHLFEQDLDVIVVPESSVELAKVGLHAVKVLIPGMTSISFGYAHRRMNGTQRICSFLNQSGMTGKSHRFDELRSCPHPLT